MPEHPALIPGVVRGADLRTQFLRAVLRLAEIERLEPRPHALAAADSQRLVPLACTADRRQDDLVRLRIGSRDAEAPAGIVRRVHHRQEHVRHRCQLLPLLSHLERTVDRRHQSEDVRRAPRAGRIHASARRSQELGECVRLALVVRAGEDLTRKPAVRLGEADVIEVHLRESGARHLLGHPDVVLPDRTVVRVHPREPLLVPPHGTVRTADRVLRIHPRRDRILEHDDARHRHDPARLQRVGQRADVGDATHSASGVAHEQGIVRREVQSELVLHVDDESVDLRGIGERHQPVESRARLRREPVHV